MGKTKDLSGMEVGARCTGLCQELQLCSVCHTQTVSRVCQEWSPTQRTSSQLGTTVGSIGVNMGKLPCETLSTQYKVHYPTNRGCSEGKRRVQFNIRKVFLMFGILRVNSHIDISIFVRFNRHSPFQSFSSDPK